MGVQLNLGGGDGWSELGWINLDVAFGYDLAENLLARYPADSVDRIYTSHCIEHLMPRDVVRLLKDARRALTPGGLIRVVVPDIDAIGDAFLYQGYEFLAETNPHYYATREARKIPLAEHIMELVGWHWYDAGVTYGAHKCVFSKSILGIMLKFCGFTDIRRVDYCQSADPEFEHEATMSNGMPIAGWDNPCTKAISLFMEARK